MLTQSIPLHIWVLVDRTAATPSQTITSATQGGCRDGWHRLCTYTGQHRNWIVGPYVSRCRMVLFRVRIHVAHRHRAQIVQSLARIVGPTRMQQGCVSCQLCCDCQEKNVLFLVEEWETQRQLEARLREDNLRVVLAAMDCAVSPPQVRFETIAETKGMELIAACRSSSIAR